MILLEAFSIFKTKHQNQVACGPCLQLSNSGQTATRQVARESFNGGMVFSSRPLRVNEIFTIRIDKIISVWCGSIEIGLVQVKGQ